MLHFFKKNLILLFLLCLLLGVAVIFLIQKSETPSFTKTETKVFQEEKKVVKPVAPVVKAKPKEPTPLQTPKEAPIVQKKIDLTPEKEPFVYSKPKLEIDQILQKQKKIDTFSDNNYSTKEKKDWEVDYKLGLEQDAPQKLKAGEPLKSEMVNGKIKFSKSF